jgi:hypothetical protein
MTRCGWWVLRTGSHLLPSVPLPTSPLLFRYRGRLSAAQASGSGAEARGTNHLSKARGNPPYIERPRARLLGVGLVIPEGYRYRSG